MYIEGRNAPKIAPNIFPIKYKGIHSKRISKSINLQLVLIYISFLLCCVLVRRTYIIFTVEGKTLPVLNVGIASFAVILNMKTIKGKTIAEAVKPIEFDNTLSKNITTSPYY